MLRCPFGVALSPAPDGALELLVTSGARLDSQTVQFFAFDDAAAAALAAGMRADPAPEPFRWRRSIAVPPALGSAGPVVAVSERSVVVAGNNGALWLDRASGQLVRTLLSGERCSALCVDERPVVRAADGVAATELFASHDRSFVVGVYETDRGRALRTLNIDRSLPPLCCLPRAGCAMWVWVSLCAGTALQAVVEFRATRRVSVQRRNAGAQRACASLRSGAAGRRDLRGARRLRSGRSHAQRCDCACMPLDEHVRVHAYLQGLAPQLAHLCLCTCAD